MSADPIPAETAPTDDPVDTLARTLWGEGRGEGRDGMTAIAAVILNRIRVSAEHGGRYWWGHDIETVCRARAQFSCWNPGDPNRAKLLAVDEDDPAFRVARQIAERAIAGQIADSVFGATSYKVANLPWPQAWGRPRTPLVEIGRHAFYNLHED